MQLKFRREILGRNGPEILENLISVIKLTISSGERIPNCTFLTERTGAFESAMAMMNVVQEVGLAKASHL